MIIVLGDRWIVVRGICYDGCVVDEVKWLILIRLGFYGEVVFDYLMMFRGDILFLW